MTTELATIADKKMQVFGAFLGATTGLLSAYGIVSANKENNNMSVLIPSVIAGLILGLIAGAFTAKRCTDISIPLTTPSTPPTGADAPSLYDIDSNAFELPSTATTAFYTELTSMTGKNAANTQLGF